MSIYAKSDLNGLQNIFCLLSGDVEIFVRSEHAVFGCRKQRVSNASRNINHCSTRPLASFRLSFAEKASRYSFLARAPRDRFHLTGSSVVPGSDWAKHCSSARPRALMKRTGDAKPADIGPQPVGPINRSRRGGGGGGYSHLPDLRATLKTMTSSLATQTFGETFSRKFDDEGKFGKYYSGSHKFTANIVAEVGSEAEGTWLAACSKKWPANKLTTPQPLSDSSTPQRMIIAARCPTGATPELQDIYGDFLAAADYVREQDALEEEASGKVALQQSRRMAVARGEEEGNASLGTKRCRKEVVDGVQKWCETSASVNKVKQGCWRLEAHWRRSGEEGARSTMLPLGACPALAARMVEISAWRPSDPTTADGHPTEPADIMLLCLLPTYEKPRNVQQNVDASPSKGRARNKKSNAQADNVEMETAAPSTPAVHDRKIGDTYAPDVLPDHRDENDNLIAPHELYSKLTEGTLFGAQISFETLFSTNRILVQSMQIYHIYVERLHIIDKGDGKAWSPPIPSLSSATTPSTPKKRTRDLEADNAVDDAFNSFKSISPEEEESDVLNHIDLIYPVVVYDLI
ncbi:hypothetical protein DFH09DRAFT_1073174 [Mycena vulgaris]|nr:hypothetical protein DFH09DRAFT_1073174 [Mycena vulgaris]